MKRLFLAALLAATPATAQLSADKRADLTKPVVLAPGARGCDLILDLEGTQDVRRHLVGSPALGEGRVVVLVKG